MSIVSRMLLLVFFLLFLLLLITFCFFREIQISGTAIVNNTVIQEPVSMRYYLFEIHEDATLPLVKVFECIGYQTVWVDKNTCTISNDMETYALDLSKHTLIGKNKHGTEENFLYFGGGETHGVIQEGDQEIYVNYYTIQNLMRMIGKTITRHFDFTKKELIIFIE